MQTYSVRSTTSVYGSGLSTTGHCHPYQVFDYYYYYSVLWSRYDLEDSRPSPMVDRYVRFRLTLLTIWRGALCRLFSVELLFSIMPPDHAMSFSILPSGGPFASCGLDTYYVWSLDNYHMEYLSTELDGTPQYSPFWRKNATSSSRP